MSTDYLPMSMFVMPKLSSRWPLYLWVLTTMTVVLAGCGGKGAVVFAPTPIPEDLSPQRYIHPSGAFSVDVPRYWAVYVQNTGTLATASFTTPGADQVIVDIVVINLSTAETTGDLADLINVYQNEVRPDAARYSEQDRQAMGDGSWRLIGVRETAGGLPQQVNTFIELSGTIVGIVNIVVPDNRALFGELETLVNTFDLNSEVALQPTTLATLSFAAQSHLSITNVNDWRTSGGVYFITGEIANHSTQTLQSIPIRVELLDESGSPVVGAVDTVMGYGVRPGDIAPFSLRFGQGQPQSATRYVLVIDETQQPQDNTQSGIVGRESLAWTDDSTILENGNLVIAGTLTNTGSSGVYDPVATVTVFDLNQRVIGARYGAVSAGELLAGDSVDFQLFVTELGGNPSSYVVNIQAQPAADS